MPFLDDSTTVIPVNSKITNSISPPSSPVEGNIWNQIDNTGNLVNKWNYANGNQWISDLKTAHI